MCIFTVKSIFKYYTGHNTPVYTCFLDASKAFDLVITIGQYLQNLFIVVCHSYLFVFLYFCTKRNNCALNVVQLHVFFTILNGVRQGGILSPKIVVLYMNRLTDKLSKSYAGCYIYDKCINHIMYADDICLMAPTGTAMQNLLDVCHNYSAANDILFNPLKSVCIVYKQKYYKLCSPSVNIGYEPLRFVNETK